MKDLTAVQRSRLEKLQAMQKELDLLEERREELKKQIRAQKQKKPISK